MDGLSDLLVTDTIHERLEAMIDRSDWVVIFPGGWGTLEELFQVVVRALLGGHGKPIGILNVAGYYDYLLRFLERAASDGFISPAQLAAIAVDDDPARLVDRLLSGTVTAPPAKAWVTGGTTWGTERPHPRPLRIAITGSGGTGKSTLTLALRDALGIPLSPERVREGLRVLGMPMARQLTLGQQATLAEWVAAERIAFEAVEDTFVADRCSVDSAAYWLLVVSRALGDPARGDRFIEAAREHVQRYTHVLLLPHGYPAELEADGYRTPDPVYQMGMHSMIRGLLDAWDVAHLDVPRLPLHERVRWVLAALGTERYRRVDDDESRAPPR